MWWSMSYGEPIHTSPAPRGPESWTPASAMNADHIPESRRELRGDKALSRRWPPAPAKLPRGRCAASAGRDRRPAASRRPPGQERRLAAAPAITITSASPTWSWRHAAAASDPERRASRSAEARARLRRPPTRARPGGTGAELSAWVASHAASAAAAAAASPRSGHAGSAGALGSSSLLIGAHAGMLRRVSPSWILSCRSSDRAFARQGPDDPGLVARAPERGSQRRPELLDRPALPGLWSEREVEAAARARAAGRAAGGAAAVGEPRAGGRAGPPLPLAIGLTPVSASYSTSASAYRSAGAPASSPAACSGAIYASGADDIARPGQRVATDHPGDAEVGQLGPIRRRGRALRDQDVRRLDVAVDDALAVGVPERVAQGDSDRDDVAVGQPALASS